MQCQICWRRQSEGLELHCPACARAALFPLRLQQAQALVEKEAAERQVNAAVTLSNTRTAHQKSQNDTNRAISDGSKALEHSRLLGDLEESKAKIETITKHAESLRSNMQELRNKLNAQREANNRRRTALSTSQQALSTDCREHATSIQQAIQVLKTRSSTQYDQLIALRVRRAKAAIAFAGLKQLKPLDGVRKAQYCIFNMIIPDIRHLNAAEHTHVSTVLYHVARLLVQLSSFLHVRLPAEITLPHADWPAPTVFSPASSYTRRDMAFPKLSPTSRDAAVKSKGLDGRTTGRPRFLFLDRKLPKLARDNPSAYALLVEGVALLAWDVAWLCRTQGLPVAEKDWDDVCDMGRNLWMLFAHAPDKPVLRRQTSARDRAANVKAAEGGRAFSPRVEVIGLGVRSHGSAHNFLEASGKGSESIGFCDVSAKGWVFAFPVKVMDELKGALLNEMSGHDWELLDGREEELADGTDAEGDVVVGETRRGERGEKGGVASAGVGGDEKGKSGWTKLKSRSRDS